jgi:hypothetical protein
MSFKKGDKIWAGPTDDWKAEVLGMSDGGKNIKLRWLTGPLAGREGLTPQYIEYGEEIEEGEDEEDE